MVCRAYLSVARRSIASLNCTLIIAQFHHQTNESLIRFQNKLKTRCNGSIEPALFQESFPPFSSFWHCGSAPAFKHQALWSLACGGDKVVFRVDPVFDRGAKSQTLQVVSIFAWVFTRGRACGAERVGSGCRPDRPPTRGGDRIRNHGAD